MLLLPQFGANSGLSPRQLVYANHVNRHNRKDKEHARPPGMHPLEAGIESPRAVGGSASFEAQDTPRSAVKASPHRGPRARRGRAQPS